MVVGYSVGFRHEQGKEWGTGLGRLKMFEQIPAPWMVNTGP